MDKSKEYIEMCRKATEIQDKWIPGEGDYICEVGYNNKDFVDIISLHDCCGGDMCDMPKFNYSQEELCVAIFLPRQDQLQGMLTKEYIDSFAMLADLYRYCIKEDFLLEDLFYGNETMEILWLMFVMKEEYNKTWNGTDWL